jgi:hypothetical protein
MIAGSCSGRCSTGSRTRQAEPPGVVSNSCGAVGSVLTRATGGSTISHSSSCLISEPCSASLLRARVTVGRRAPTSPPRTSWDSEIRSLVPAGVTRPQNSVVACSELAAQTGCGLQRTEPNGSPAGRLCLFLPGDWEAERRVRDGLQTDGIDRGHDCACGMRSNGVSANASASASAHANASASAHANASAYANARANGSGQLRLAVRLCRVIRSELPERGFSALGTQQFRGLRVRGQEH